MTEEEARTAILERLSRELADKGKLIEAGFVALRLKAMAKDASDIQVREMRMAFMAGAQHLFASIMTILDPGDEPSEKDLARMSLISNELDNFRHELVAWLPTEGRA
jgi:hypothetical protein